MLIHSAVFGPVDVNEAEIITMDCGPFGFEDYKKYVIIEHEDNGVILRWLQSSESSYPCFVLFDPLDIVVGYRPRIDFKACKLLDCNDVSDLKTYVIGVVPDDYTKATVNLKSPIIFNPANYKAAQVILYDQDYSMRFPIAQCPDSSLKAVGV